MESKDLLEKLDQVGQRMRASNQALKRSLHEQGEEMRAGFAECREAIQANREALQANQEAVRETQEAVRALARTVEELGRAVETVGRSQETMGRAQERQEMRFTAWLEGVEARLTRHQDDTEESFQMVSGVVRTWLHRQVQDAERLEEGLQDHEQRLRALESRPPAA